jgi:hypothetical protein
LQLGVLCFGFLQDVEVGVPVFFSTSPGIERWAKNPSAKGPLWTPRGFSGLMGLPANGETALLVAIVQTKGQGVRGGLAVTAQTERYNAYEKSKERRNGAKSY